MKNLILAATGVTALILSACNNSGEGQTSTASADEDALIPCIRTVLKLDEGTWDYMATIARMNGTFRTFETSSVHASTGTDTWSTRSYGGDVGAEYSNETNHVKLIGTTVFPLDKGEPIEPAGIKYTACSGPDKEGRYEIEMEYSEPFDETSRIYVKNQTWRSEHGSHFTEDHTDESGRLVARRSGVLTPAKSPE